MRPIIARETSLSAMCGRLRVRKDFLHARRLRSNDEWSPVCYGALDRHNRNGWARRHAERCRCRHAGRGPSLRPLCGRQPLVFRELIRSLDRARGVSYPTNQKPGTIVVSTAQRRLYLVLGNGQALSYAIAVRAAGYAWSGASQITDKRERPDWTPPEQMLQRRPDLPRHKAGGPDNPMGAPRDLSRREPLSHSRFERA